IGNHGQFRNGFIYFSGVFFSNQGKKVGLGNTNCLILQFAGRCCCLSVVQSDVAKGGFCYKKVQTVTNNSKSGQHCWRIIYVNK
ncbi:MAG: hypothetical protein IJ322_05485, partial [Clostridia bacterium]|nr:hypothetical protein [Clostridia bacterium]